MTSHLAILSERELSSLAARAAELPEVHDYYLGWYGGSHQGPDNVLLFARAAESLHKLAKAGRDYHHRYVLSMALRGGGEVEVDGKLLLFQPGDVLLLPPFVPHRYPMVETRNLVWLFVTFDLAAPRPEHLAISRYRITAEVASLVSAMIQWRVTVAGQRPDVVARRSTALAAALLLERLAAAPGGSTIPSDSITGDAERWLASVLQRIGDMSEPPPTLEQLAAVANLSSSRLRSQFQKRFGISLGLYSRRLRVRHAVSMVVSGNLTLGEAAIRCGFSSVYVFSRSAKSILGCPPREYVERARSGWS